MVEMKLALISLPVCKLIDDCENWVYVWQESNGFCNFVILILWKYKKSENDSLYGTIEPDRDFLLFLEITKATDTKQACSGYDTEMAVYFWVEITVILLWYVEKNS